MEYETANPGQDFDENETKLFDPERDVDRPIVNLVAPENTSDRPSQSRPISGDTLSGYRREEIPLEQLKTNGSGGQISSPAKKSPPRRGSSPLTPVTYGGSTAATDSPVKESQMGDSNSEDIVHGGAHYSQTANRLDPRAHGGLQLSPADGYDQGPDVEAGLPGSKIRSHAEGL